jgi:hypothetical protein
MSFLEAIFFWSVFGSPQSFCIRASCLMNAYYSTFALVFGGKFSVDDSITVAAARDGA